VIEIQAAAAANLVQLLTLTPREIAKATARGINRATAVGRQAAQGYLPTAFPGARPRALAWMRRMVRFERQDRATPERLAAKVSVGAPSWYMRAPWMLLPTFEQGGMQLPRAAEGRNSPSALVPTLGLRLNVAPVGRQNPKSLSPKALGLAYRLDAEETIYLGLGRGSLGGAKRGNKPRVGRGRVYGKERTFVIRVNGIDAIMQRTGRGKSGTLRALWWLRPQQTVPRRPWFADTSRRATEAVLDRYTAEEMAKQLTWARERRGVFG